MFQKFEPSQLRASSTKIETQNYKETKGNLTKPNEHIPGGFLYHDTTSMQLYIKYKQNLFGQIAQRIQPARHIILFRYILEKTQSQSFKLTTKPNDRSIHRVPSIRF